MILILMGAPGAGKGTQAEYLRNTKGFLKISTGDLFRREISLKTDLGKQVEATINQGGFVSDGILLQIMKNELEACKSQNIVLDGFPRTIPQATWLSENAKVSGVVHIDVERGELVSRIEGRLICSKCEAVYQRTRKPPLKAGWCDRCGNALRAREDDKLEKVLHRLDIYSQQTEPVLDYYRQRREYIRMDGNQGEEAVSKQLDALLDKLAS